MNKFKKVSALVLAGTTLMLASGASHGLGFGRPSSRAVLGEKLQFQVPLRLESGEDVTSDCLVGDVYLGDDKLPSGSVSVSVQRPLGGDAVLSVRTLVAVNEPVVTLYLVAGCQAKVTRKFVVFVDPPSVTAPNAGSDTLPLLAESVGGGDRPSPVVAARPAKRVPAKAPASDAKGKLPSGDTPVDVAAAPRQPGAARAAGPGMSPALGAASARTAAAPASRTASSGRLVLDPVEQDATVIPNLQMSSALGASAVAADDSPEARTRRAAAAALWQALNASPEQMARDRQRLTELTERLATLQKEAQEARQAIDGLQARAREAESNHAPNWLTAVLGGGLLAALGGCAFFYQRLRQRHGATRWWHAEGMAPADTTTAAELPQPPVEALPQQAEPVAAVPSFTGVPSRMSEPAPAVFTPVGQGRSVVGQSSSDGLASPTVTASVAAMASLSLEAAPDAPAPRMARTEPLREVSVEELIDLEQQAEFFVVLGQDDAAIDLLEGHVQSTTGASPLPFLKLLEMYQRMNRRGDYERVQAAFNERFNGYAPAWESDLQQGHSLVDYPGVVERLQSLWASPHNAMDVLEKSLTRPDHDAETFDLPAYRELLLLYAVARDLSERESKDREAVDLLLPVADTPSGLSLGEDNEVEPLMATRPVKAHPEVRPSISLDLQLDDIGLPEPTQAYGVRPIVTGNLAPHSNEIEFEHIDIPTSDTPPPRA
jgi:pilus assembly protein FimV